MPYRVLFLCTGNACRSQMAEGWARHLHGDTIAAWSAGIMPRGVDPRAVAVMKEVGIDLGRHTSKHLDALRDIDFDLVVTVCDHAADACPVFPGIVRRLHHGFDDPPRLARSAKTEEETLQHYRRVRDEIRRYVQRLPEILAPETPE